MDTEFMDESAALLLRDFTAEQRQVAEKALKKISEIFRGQNPDIPKCLDRLARHYEAQQKYMKAETIYRLVVAMRTRDLPKHHPALIQSMVNLAEFYCSQRLYSEATVWFDQALELGDTAAGHNLRGPMFGLTDLARIYVSHRACSTGVGAQLWTKTTLDQTGGHA